MAVSRSPIMRPNYLILLLKILVLSNMKAQEAATTCCVHVQDKKIKKIKVERDKILYTNLFYESKKGGFVLVVRHITKN